MHILSIKTERFTPHLSPDNKIALNPTTIHEVYHTLFFSYKWDPKETADALKVAFKQSLLRFFNQTRKTSIITLNLSVQYKLGGRDFPYNRQPTT